ncbi:MAG: hypothetical protein IPI79_12555 [Moraxellaceae bacterium]|nr:hypothetical protein [Moraxellaceae bacterium]
MTFVIERNKILILSRSIPIPNHNHACVLSFRDIQDVEGMLLATQQKTCCGIGAAY